MLHTVELHDWLDIWGGVSRGENDPLVRKLMWYSLRYVDKCDKFCDDEL